MTVTTITPSEHTNVPPALRGSSDPNTLHLSYEQVEALGRDLDEVRARVVADLGTKDREYLYSIIRAQRGFEIAGRGLLFFGWFPPTWLLGTLLLALILRPAPEAECRALVRIQEATTQTKRSRQLHRRTELALAPRRTGAFHEPQRSWERQRRAGHVVVVRGAEVPHHAPEMRVRVN